jgi:Protein of unknown function (DUF3078)
MRKLFSFGIALTFALPVLAQTPEPPKDLLRPKDAVAADTVKPWRYGGFGLIQLNQTSLSNWAGGGQSSIAVNSVVSFYARYRKRETSWDLSLDAGYGLLKQGDERMRKNEDKVELNSKYGKLAFGKFYYAALLNFRTQFAPGYDFPNDSVVISRGLAPAYLTLAAGLDYRPNDYFTAFLAPVTGKFTFVTDQRLADQGAFGVTAATYDEADNRLKAGESMRSEFGAILMTKFQKDIFKNVNLLTRLTLFDNYTNKDKTKRANIDVNFDALLAMKVNKYLTSTLFIAMVYDDDIAIPLYEKQNGERVQTGAGPRLQFKEVLGLGLSYKFAR